MPDVSATEYVAVWKACAPAFLACALAAVKPRSAASPTHRKPPSTEPSENVQVPVAVGTNQPSHSTDLLVLPAATTPRVAE